MRVLQKTLLPILLLGLASPATAATTLKTSGASGVTGDVRCLMTMFVLSQNKTQPQAAQAGQAGVFFFTGRLSVHAPGADLGPIMKAQAQTLGGPQLQAEIQRCGPIVQAGQRSLQAGFASLRPAGPPPSAAAPGVAPAAAAPAPK
jgi:hypothetical protein